MSWLAQLDVDYRVEHQRCVARHVHQGPLRILKSLYPEGDTVCHNILVHPPSGLVGGDEIIVNLQLQAQAHALITTPGATRFYGSDDLMASQKVHARLDDHARLEWLPLETLAYSGCKALNQVVFQLAPQSQLIAWDIMALGLPHAGQPFVKGQFQQHLAIEGVWLERGLIKADDTRLMQSPLGLNGHSGQAMLIIAQGTSMEVEYLDRVMQIARDVCEHHELRLQAGVTSPKPEMVVVRVLTDQLEPARALLQQIWLQWRHQIWGMPAVAPRIWAM